jgi:CDP-glycerol glycerophosphotransferase (TagB/SpsB family)
MLSAASRFGHRYLAIAKLHPAEVKSEFRRQYRTLLKAGRIRLLQREDIGTVLAAIDVAVVYTSTVALEAMLIGKPVIMYAPVGNRDPYGFIEKGAAIGARTATELATAIRTVLEDKATGKDLAAGRRRAIAAHLGRLDGRASDRVAGLVRQLVNSDGF